MLKQNADGSYVNPWSVNWVDNSGKQRTDPLDINCKCFDPEKTVVLNPAAWQAVPDAIWSPQTNQLADFRQSRRPSEAMNFARTFRFKERYSLQVRAEFQNVFNRTFLPTPQIANLNFTAVPQRLADGRYNAGFGTFGNLRANNVFGANGGGRNGLFIARFNF
jgi:predicted acylesterase/phospholipase RssA